MDQHVSNEVLRTGPKFQSKIQRPSEACNQRGGQLYSKYEGLREIGHNTRKSIFETQQCLQSHI